MDRVEYSTVPGNSKQIHLVGFPSESSDLKKKRNVFQKCSIVTGVLGLGFILIGFISYFLMKSFVEEKILENYSIKEGTPFFESWKNPQVALTIYVYFLNFTNHAEFLAGRHRKPILQEVGPYVYIQDFSVDSIHFFPSSSGEGNSTPSTVSYKTRRVHSFSRELTPNHLSDEDRFIVPNLPLFGAIKEVSTKGSFAKSFFESLIQGYDFAKDREPFLDLSVEEFLWSYPSLLMSIAKLQKCQEEHSMGSFFEDYSHGEENCDIVESKLETFGLFKSRDNISEYETEINTGAENIMNKGKMVSWLGKKKLNYWSGDLCNSVRGLDPGSLPIDIQKSETLPLFIGQLCRIIDFNYHKEVPYGKTMTYRFVADERSFDSSSAYPPNSCYCIEHPCLPSGLLDISGCQPGAPIYMSWPHFLHGDPRLVESVVGLHPDPKKHSFYMDIEPKYGIQLTIQGRLQMNVIVKKDPDFLWFSKVAQETTVLPFVWVEEGIQGPPENIMNAVSKLLTLPNDVKYGLSVACLFFGLILQIPLIVYLAKTCSSKK